MGLAPPKYPRIKSRSNPARIASLGSDSGVGATRHTKLVASPAGHKWDRRYQAALTVWLSALTTPRA
jgi:hypothetical protein